MLAGTNGDTFFATLAGEAKAVNGKLAADIRGVSFTIYYTRVGNTGTVQASFLFSIGRAIRSRCQSLCLGRQICVNKP